MTFESLRPPETTFDIYFGRANQPLKKLGRTRYCSWPMEGLIEGATYNWRVEAITVTDTNRSPACSRVRALRVRETP
jgi:hypothetical protein